MSTKIVGDNSKGPHPGKVEGFGGDSRMQIASRRTTRTSARGFTIFSVRRRTQVINETTCPDGVTKSRENTKGM